LGEKERRKHRSRSDIIIDILNAATEGTLKTKIMYTAYLSFDQLNEYLELVIDRGLLEYNSEKKLYKTTSKGQDFLVKSKKLKL